MTMTRFTTLAIICALLIGVTGTASAMKVEKSLTINVTAPTAPVITSDEGYAEYYVGETAHLTSTRIANWTDAEGNPLGEKLAKINYKPILGPQLIVATYVSECDWDDVQSEAFLITGYDPITYTVTSTPTTPNACDVITYTITGLTGGKGPLTITWDGTATGGTASPDKMSYTITASQLNNGATVAVAVEDLLVGREPKP
jgi:hypothetical protein